MGPEKVLYFSWMLLKSTPPKYQVFKNVGVAQASVKKLVLVPNRAVPRARKTDPEKPERHWFQNDQVKIGSWP